MSDTDPNATAIDPKATTANTAHPTANGVRPTPGSERPEVHDDPPLDFSDLEPIAIPVPIMKRKYLLREASGDAACKYRNAMIRMAKLKDGKPSAFDGLADLDPLIVSLCLYEVTADGKVMNKPVPVDVVRNWPNRVQKALAKKARDISSLDDREDQKALEKRFVDVCKKVAGLSESDDDRKAWEEWMTNHIREALKTAVDGESLEDPSKNSQEPTMGGSDSPTS